MKGLTGKVKLILALAGVFALALTLTISACGGGDSTTSSAGDSKQEAEKSDDSKKSGAIDACTIVTQADATKVFGQQAVKDDGTPIYDPKMIGECLWTWDTDTDNQLIQFRVWNGEQYHSDGGAEAKPLDVGEKGWITTGGFLGVDIEWIQDGKTVSLSYSNVGPNVPDPSTKAEAMKTLAKKVEEEL